MVERRTASGKSLNMEALMAEHEDIIAVGNARTNARGDQLGPGGEVIKTAQQVATAYYKENPKAVITQSTKEELGVTQQTTLQPDNLTAEKQEFDEWNDPENTVETPTGKVTKEEDRVIASGDAKKQKKQKSKEAVERSKKSIDDLYT
jgi:hypothetical protein|tara:strand:- start:439 stop:882 length:444 start_codon:yes stop_codon:yes gene_type:complete